MFATCSVCTSVWHDRHSDNSLSLQPPQHMPQLAPYPMAVHPSQHPAGFMHMPHAMPGLVTHTLTLTLTLTLTHTHTHSHSHSHSHTLTLTHTHTHTHTHTQYVHVNVHVLHLSSQHVYTCTCTCTCNVYTRFGVWYVSLVVSLPRPSFILS